MSRVDTPTVERRCWGKTFGMDRYRGKELKAYSTEFLYKDVVTITFTYDSAWGAVTQFQAILFNGQGVVGLLFRGIQDGGNIRIFKRSEPWYLSSIFVATERSWGVHRHSSRWTRNRLKPASGFEVLEI